MGKRILEETAARVAATETGWGQRQHQPPETPALSCSREQVLTAQTGWCFYKPLPCLRFLICYLLTICPFISLLLALKDVEDCRLSKYGTESQRMVWSLFSENCVCGLMWLGLGAAEQRMH